MRPLRGAAVCLAVLLCCCKSTNATRAVAFRLAPISAVAGAAPRARSCVAAANSKSKAVAKKVAGDAKKAEKKRKENLSAAFGYLFLFGQLAPAFATAAGRLGLFKPPPLNLLTEVANNAMDEAIRTGEIPALMGTVYGQGVWKDLIGQYYASGESTAFLTKVGGICMQHPVWCDGITLPL